MWLLSGAFLAEDDPNANPGALHGFERRDIICCPTAAKTRETRKLIHRHLARL